GVEVQAVDETLDIHPIMLSRWRTAVRDGSLKGRARRMAVPRRSARELQQLQALKREHATLKEEHELLKKAIRFCSARSGRSSRSWTANAEASR
ncbi:MAG TPA: hypothetical protein VLD59_01155, partial [Steroidobacteraceae bacterium]|nr:hypothetical protein [Steroidobacteraceae bacterium]